MLLLPFEICICKYSEPDTYCRPRALMNHYKEGVSLKTFVYCGVFLNNSRVLTLTDLVCDSPNRSTVYDCTRSTSLPPYEHAVLFHCKCGSMNKIITNYVDCLAQQAVKRLTIEIQSRPQKECYKFAKYQQLNYKCVLHGAL